MNELLSRIKTKRFLLTLLSSSVFLTGCAFTIIWLYLSNLGRLDILYDAISVSNAFGIILGFTLFSIAGFSLIFFISSLLLFLIYTSNEKHFKKYEGISHAIATTSWCNGLFYCCAMISGFCLTYYLKWNSLVCILFTFLLSITFSFFLTRRRIFKKFQIKSYVDDQDRTNLLNKRFSNILFAFLLFTPAFVQMLPIIIIAKQMYIPEGTDEVLQIFLFTLIGCVILTIGYFPGMILINEKEGKNITQLASYTFIIIPTALFIISAIFPPMPYLMLNMSMNLAGVSDWRTHIFYIDEKDFNHNMFKPVLWRTHHYENIQGKFFIYGVNIFTLGNTKLICPEEINKARKESLTFAVLDHGERSQKGELLKVSAMKCIPFNKDTIHLWDSPIANPVVYPD